jgi:hypothetical protein
MDTAGLLHHIIAGFGGDPSVNDTIRFDPELKQSLDL